MLKKFLGFILSVGGIIVLSGGVLMGAQEAQTEMTITGEVVDTACFLKHGKQGASHKACAEACMNAGQDMAIYERETDTLYVLLENRPGTDPNKPIKYHVAQTVAVTGKVVRKANVNGIIIKEVQVDQLSFK